MMLESVGNVHSFFKTEREKSFPFASLHPIFIEQIRHYLADLQRSTESMAELCVDIRREAKLSGLSVTQYIQYLSRIEELHHPRTPS